MDPLVGPYPIVWLVVMLVWLGIIDVLRRRVPPY